MQIKTRAPPGHVRRELMMCVLQVERGRVPATFAHKMAEVHHETVFFSGHVQGVGFRYSVLQIAREFDVAGYVSNLVDGRVQLEAEGGKSDVDAFISAIAEKMHGYIRKVERRAGNRPPQFRGFVIK
jgi:acylphosphatase